MQAFRLLGQVHYLLLKRLIRLERLQTAKTTKLFDFLANLTFSVLIVVQGISGALPTRILHSP